MLNSGTRIWALLLAAGMLVTQLSAAVAAENGLGGALGSGAVVGDSGTGPVAPASITLNIIAPSHGVLTVRVDDASGDVLADGDSIPADTLIWATASADPGWQVDGIKIAGSYTPGDSASILLSGNGVCDISAKISRDPNSHTVTFDAGGGGGSSNSDRLTGGTSASQAADKPSSNVDASGGVKPADAANEAAKAIADAIKAGNAPRANVVVKNAKSVSPETLRAMAEDTQKAGGTAQLLADTTVDGKIAARVYIDAAIAANLQNDIQLGVSVDEKDTKATKDAFEKFFVNDVAVVRMAHQGPIGARVRVAVKVDLAALDKNNLRIYAYDKKTNTYYPIANPECFIDSAGYLHFSTERGGDIIVSSGELVKK